MMLRRILNSDDMLRQTVIRTHSKHETLAQRWFSNCWPTVYDVDPTVNQRWANV